MMCTQGEFTPMELFAARRTPLRQSRTGFKRNLVVSVLSLKCAPLFSREEFCVTVSGNTSPRVTIFPDSPPFLPGKC